MQGGPAERGNRRPFHPIPEGWPHLSARAKIRDHLEVLKKGTDLLWQKCVWAAAHFIGFADVAIDTVTDTDDGRKGEMGDSEVKGAWKRRTG